MKHRYVRVGDELVPDSLLVRGGELDPEVIQGDALRHHAVYGTYAVSVFSVRDLSLDELAQRPPLVRFARLTLLTAGTVRAAGLRLEPTGHNPLHYSLRSDDLVGIERLCSCEHRVWANPYYVA